MNHPDLDTPSKTQRKREAEVLFQLGRRLCQLSDAQLELIELPIAIRDALLKTRRITAHVAHKRELQYLAKLLRQVDTTTIVQGLETALAPGRDETRRHHRIENWRDRLLSEGDAALGQLMNLHPAIDARQFRNLVRQANTQAQRHSAPRAARQLFKLLAAIDADSPLPES